MKHTNPPLLKVRNLSYFVDRRKKHTSILEGVSFDLTLGESMIIIGPNGAGKSTLLKSIAGLLNSHNTKGEVFLEGSPTTELSQRRRSQLIAYVPQRPVLPPRMKLLDYVLLGRTPYVSPFGKESKSDVEVAMDAIEKTETTPYMDRPLHTLSGGEAQLAVIARALATKAPLLLLDEPTSSLDLGNRIGLHELIQKLPKGQNGENEVATLTTIHDLQLAGHYGDRFLLMDDGKICAEGTPAEVLTSENILTHYGVAVDTMVENGGVSIIPKYPYKE